MQPGMPGITPTFASEAGTESFISSIASAHAKAVEANVALRQGRHLPQQPSLAAASNVNVSLSQTQPAVAAAIVIPGAHIAGAHMAPDARYWGGESQVYGLLLAQSVLAATMSIAAALASSPFASPPVSLGSASLGAMASMLSDMPGPLPTPRVLASEASSGSLTLDGSHVELPDMTKQICCCLSKLNMLLTLRYFQNEQ